MSYIHAFIYSFILFIVFVTTLMLDMSIKCIDMTSCFNIIIYIIAMMLECWHTT